MSNYNGQFQDSGANILLPTPHSYANIEGATASQAYLVGQMVVFNNRLCEVISAISSGDTFTIGSNIAYKNVGDIGKQLVASDGTGFYFDVKDGAYGFYPSASKTASEFVPFGGSQVATGTGTLTNNVETTVEVGFRPSIVVMQATRSSNNLHFSYCKDAPIYTVITALTNNGNSVVRFTDIPNTTAGTIRNITDTGFVYHQNSTAFPAGTAFSYVAIK